MEENTETKSRNDELEHIRDWKYIIKNWDFILKNSRSLLIKSLRFGVSTKYRGKIWYLLTNAEETKSKASFTLLLTFV